MQTTGDDGSATHFRGPAGLPTQKSVDTGERPELWNPNAAAAWSLLFTPAFGGFLHAADWRVLGDAERASANKFWAWASVGVLVVNLLALVVGIESPAVDVVLGAVSIGLIVGWYLTQGRVLAARVRALPGGYTPRSWLQPVLCGLGGLIGYFGLSMVLVLATEPSTASDLAQEVQPLILAEWQKLPELQDASIQQVELVHEGGNTYRGFVDATFGGAATRLGIEVIADPERVLWELHELDSPTEATESTEDAVDGELVAPPRSDGPVQPVEPAPGAESELESETVPGGTPDR